jgi:hypothetical protein
MKSRDTKPGLSDTEPSRNVTTPGIGAWPTDDDPTDPAFRPESVREIAELRSILLDDDLDDLETAANDVLIPERRDSDGARSARYAGAGVPARAANVTVPTGDVVVAPEDEGPRSQPPEEVVGRMRDPAPQGSLAESGPESSARSEGREVPSGSVHLGMALDPPRASRKDVDTAPSGRKIELEVKRQFVLGAAKRLLRGLLVAAVVTSFGVAYWRFLQNLPAKGNSKPSAVSVAPPPAETSVLGPTSATMVVAPVSVGGTASSASSAHDVPKRVSLPPSASEKTLKPIMVPQVASAAKVPATGPQVP